MRIEFKFTGGFRDGATLVGDTNQPRSASAYPFLTDNAQIGKRVTEMPQNLWREMMEMVRSREATDDLGMELQDLSDRMSESDFDETRMEQEFKRIFQRHEIIRPETGHKLQFSNFKRQIYEIESREIRDECIYATATYVCEESENYMEDWPPT